MWFLSYDTGEILIFILTLKKQYHFINVKSTSHEVDSGLTLKAFLFLYYFAGEICNLYMNVEKIAVFPHGNNVILSPLK